MNVQMTSPLFLLVVFSYHPSGSGAVQTINYRAPELLLNIKPMCPSMDIWSLGCTTFELATGMIQIPCSTESDVLAFFEHTLGPLPQRMLRAASHDRQRTMISKFGDSI